MKIFLLISLLLSSFLVGAQSFTVRGIVRAKADQAVLPGATIKEKGTAKGTTTDAQGRFTLTTTSPRPRLVVSLIGYVTRELPITKNESSLVVVLAAAEMTLGEVVVMGSPPPHREEKSSGYAVATVTGAADDGFATPARSASAAPARLSGRVAGLKVSGMPVRRADRGRASPRAEEKFKAAAPGATRAGAGTLTAGEVNDFGKWKLWPDIAQKDLSEWRQRWQISPLKRYSAQLVTEDGFPVVGAPVRLKDSRDSVLWQAQTDNTGKCELWNNLFAGSEAKKVASLQAVVGGKTYAVSEPTAFHDGINLLRVQQPCRAPSVIDVAFVVDATGSMGDEIKYLQVELQDVIAQAKDSLAAATLHLGSVFYRDAGDEYVTRTTPLSANIEQTLDFIRHQEANGGGDTPEAVDQALAVAINDLAWTAQARARLLFLILDAAPHENPQVLASLQQSIRRAAAKGIRLIPIAASGTDKSTEYLMRSMALATNGTYVFLTDDSGVGNAHIKPTTDKFDVERLNTLLVKLISRYAYTTNCQVLPASKNSKAGTLTGHYQQAADTAATAAKPARRSKEYSWKCYPNPTSDVLHVELEGEVAELFVADVTGKIVLRVVPTRHAATIQLGSFPTGIYFLRFYTGKEWEQAKFLVSR